LKQAHNVILITSEHEDRIVQGSYDELCASGDLKPQLLEMKSQEISPEESDSQQSQEMDELKGLDAEDINELNRDTRDWGVYKYYFKHIGLLRYFVFVSFAALNTLSGTFSSKSMIILRLLKRNLIPKIGIWLKWWSDIDSGRMGLYISVYFLLSFGSILGLGGYAWYVDSQGGVLNPNKNIRAVAVVIAPATGRSLHKVLLDVILQLVILESGF
jgi:hypothetical protein